MHFVAPVALERGLAEQLAVDRALVAVDDVRGRTKADLPENDARPDIRVDADSFTVTIDGDVVEPAPVAELPLAQRYFLF